jgi:hypothetical protein
MLQEYTPISENAAGGNDGKKAWGTGVRVQVGVDR